MVAWGKPISRGHDGPVIGDPTLESTFIQEQYREKIWTPPPNGYLAYSKMAV